MTDRREESRQELRGQILELGQVFEFFWIGYNEDLIDLVFADFNTEHTEGAPVEIGDDPGFPIDFQISSYEIARHQSSQSLKDATGNGRGSVDRFGQCRSFSSSIGIEDSVLC